MLWLVIHVGCKGHCGMLAVFRQEGGHCLGMRYKIGGQLLVHMAYHVTIQLKMPGSPCIPREEWLRSNKLLKLHVASLT